jgi:hypothetical protein
MSEEHAESIQLEQVTELAPKPKRVYKKSTKQADNPLPPAILPEPSPPPAISPVPPSIPTEQPVKEKKARTQKQIDAFNKMREAYLNKRQTPVIEPVKEPEPVKQPEQVSEPYEIGTKKVQKPRAKKNKQVEPQEEPQNVHANPPVINNSPTLPPVAIPKVSTAPRFVFV